MAGSIVSSLVEKLGDLAIQEALRLYGLDDKVGQLRRELQAISGFLEYADSRQKHDERVKNWVKEIREVAYDAEDIMYSFELEVERHTPNPRLLSRHSIGKKIEGITARINEIANRRTTYGIGDLGKSSGSSLPDHGLQVWRRSSPYLDDDPVVGFAVNSQEILQRLLDPQTGRRVVSIVGMGGIGKTTLATQVFNEISSLHSGGHSQSSYVKSHRSHPTIGKVFDICIWISVTQDPDIADILVGSIEDIMKEKCMTDVLDGSEKYDKLVTKMIKLLRGSRYLVVMDDLWSNDVWDLMKRALPDDNNGSRVLITARSIETATYADSNCDPYHLQPLTDAESHELLFRRVFSTSAVPAELEDLSWKLSRKCGGLPLALVVLGGLLSAKQKHPAVWLSLVNSMTWESTENGKQLLKILAMSYEALPYQMKSCFLYFSAFPQGSEVLASKLIELWTAEGLIVREEGRRAEETAEDYLEELIQRCLVQASKRGSDERVKRVRLHDLLLEVSVTESRECQFFHVKHHFTQNVVSKVRQGVHRLSLHNAAHASIVLEGNTKLRTLLVFNKRRVVVPGAKKTLFNKLEKGLTWLQYAKSYFRLSSPPSIIAYKSSSILEFMRVLDLEGMHMLNTLPQEIGKMIHLRYLNLRGTSLQALPPELSKLHLQTLNIRGTSIKVLPAEFWSLKTLRHLYLPDLLSRPTLEGLTNLQTLHLEQMKGALPELTNLRKLKIDLFSEMDTLSSLRQMMCLVSLKLNSHSFGSDLFTAVSAHQTFQELKLIGILSMKQLPDGSEFPRYITKLTLTFSALEEDPMPKLERLLSLRVLNLRQNAYAGKEMSCSANGFPRLQSLELNSLSDLRVWNVEVGAMACLKSLTMRYCSRLAVLPGALRSITTLQKVRLEYIHRIPDTLQRDNGEDWFKIEHAPSITIIGPR